jgi:hypothetical protein
MPDSKISQLESADKIYDHDLMVVVTGYNSPGSYPENKKISLDRIRKDIVRLNEMIFFISGFSGYYNTGENLFYITSHQQAGNLMRLDYPIESPYSPQRISTTGLNAINGNNIEIQFNSGTPAQNIYGGVGSPYHSGIISTTGLNFIAGTGIGCSVSESWPHKYTVSQLDLRAVASQNFTYGPVAGATTAIDVGLYHNINWLQSNSQPLIDNATSYCYNIEFFINNFSLNFTTETLPTPESKDRPTLSPYNTPITWASCNITTSLPSVIIGMNGNNIINTIPPNNPIYYSGTSGIYLKYIEKRNLNSNSTIQPYYTITPAYYTRNCSGTYTYQVNTVTQTQNTYWSDAGVCDTILSIGPYRHLNLDFAKLI